MGKLVREIIAAIKSAEKKELKAAFRLNLTSDLPWEKIKVQGTCNKKQNANFSHGYENTKSN